MSTAVTAAHGAHDDAHIRRSVRTYMIVFAALMLLTLVTVAVSYVRLPTRIAVVLAMIIALVKGTLVAAFFMHLISEKKAIYGVLFVAATCLIGLFGLTLLGWYDQVRVW